MAVFALVAASEFNSDDFSSKYKRGMFDEVVAVDGGFAHLCKLGIVPDVVLGDFDSLDFVPDHQHVFRHPPQKDASDLELALDLVLREGADELWAYGCLGGRLDHTISALQSLASVAEGGVSVSVVGVPSAEVGYERGMALHMLVGPASLTLLPAEGAPVESMRGVVSVHSACDVSEGVFERGLEYSLEGATMTNRTSRGLSNELVGRTCSVGVAKGTLFVVCPATCRMERAILTM